MVTTSITPITGYAPQLDTADGAVMPTSHLTGSADRYEFQALMNDSDSADESITLGSGMMQLGRNVESGKANMQAALMQASLSASPSALRDAVSALSRYDLQTLFLSKVANKAFQAVDRLTNLQ